MKKDQKQDKALTKFFEGLARGQRVEEMLYNSRYLTKANARSFIDSFCFQMAVKNISLRKLKYLEMRWAQENNQEVGR